mgnify:FL=1
MWWWWCVEGGKGKGTNYAFLERFTFGNVGSEKSPNGLFVQVGALLGLLGLLGEKYSLDVRQNSTLCDGHTGEKFVELLVVADGELKMTGNDPCLLVVAGSVSCELENLSCKVFHYSGEVDWGTGSNALTIVSFAEKTMDTSYWELKSSPAGSGLGLALCLTAFTSSRHVLLLLCVRTEIVSNASVSVYI